MSLVDQKQASGFQLSVDGFEILPFLSKKEFSIVKSYAIDWLSSLFRVHANRSLSEEEIRTYHSWGKREGIPHGEILRAKNRHTLASAEIRTILFENSALSDALARIGIRKFELWDEGLGWLAFRLIRPGPGDGYPFSCKSWGPAKGVFSVSLPIVGFSQDVMMNLMPGSHLKEYPKYLPTDTHFTKDEYRLDYLPQPEECIRPKLQEGEAILFHPKVIHAEEVEKGEETRFNLEFRIVPL